ncbi:B-type cyclin [Maublancomyces gigas]|uniref:B-type cyclin n=1 Tax=Discina gigas TaxID=1032678 RepID=A0ABR3GHX7_9PEZI
MDAKPQRPSRAIRVRQDENASRTVINQKSITTVATAALKSMDPQKGVVGLKAGPRRTAFGDVSNTVKNIITENAKNATGVILVNEKQIPQKTTGVISKPALRANIKTASSITTQPLNVSNAVGSRKDARRPAVYQDKRPSPKRPSPKRASPPKVSRDAIAKKESQYTQASNQAGKSRFSKAFSRPLSNLVKQVSSKEEVPVYSDQHPHLYSGGYIDEEDEEDNGVEIEDDDVSGDEEERLEGDKIRVGASTEVISDYESDEGEDEDDESEYTATRGDNTTGVTLALPLVPRWTLQAKKELQIVQKEFDYFDEEDEGDISMVAEYGEEIFEYMRELEIKLLPNASYMDHQSEIQWSMRAILMDWLVQVHTRFNLLPETLFLCQNYVDRFLSSKVVSLGKLQLVGATALFVAAKYEEINCPSVHEIVYMVDNGYTAEEILKAERFMLAMLNFELGWPGPMSFLRRISKADDYDLETRTLAKYFLEITIMDERFVGSPPSFLAAGAHCLARHMLKKGQWTPAHTFYSGYTAVQLESLIHTLVECCENPKNHHGAVYDKFSDRRYKRASLYVQNWMNRDVSGDEGEAEEEEEE